MGRISVGEAIGAGFGLIRREPAAFLAWCGVYLLLGGLPQVFILPQTAQMYEAIGSGATLTSPDVQSIQGRVGALQPLYILFALALMAILPAAAYRAVLFPEDRRFFYLRLGMREFWTLIVSLIVILLWAAALVASFLPVMLVAGVGAATGAGPIVVLFVFLLLPVALGAAIWLTLRFSMAPVMSFADNRFRVPESWRLTKGHAWRLFLTALGLFGLILLVEIVLPGTAFAVLGASRPNIWSTLRANPGAGFAQLFSLPALIAATVLSSVLSAWMYAMGGAAWASIYRQLRPPLAETFS